MLNQTIFTTRIDSPADPIEFSVTMSKFVYHATKPGNRPNSVILVNKDDYRFAIPAAALTHFPYNGPILLTDKNSLDKRVESELKRLSPSDSVFLVGNLSQNIETEVRNLGLKTYSMLSNDPIDNAINIFNFLNKPMDIMIVSVDSFEDSVIVCSWSAHMATPVLFTNKDSMPAKTIDIIKQNNISNAYVIGSNNSISFDIVNQMKQIRNTINVQRIQGKNSYETNVNFLKFHDMAAMFGWGFNQKQGYSFSFSNKDNWQFALCGSLLSHTGKHTPVLLINKDNIPVEVKTYIDSVNPSTGMPKPPFLHGYILGGTDVISYNTQVELDGYLKNIAWLGNKRIEKMDYKIKSGDSVQSLASLYNITQQEIMQLNPNIAPNMLQMGQTVTIPVTMDIQ